MMFKSSVQWSFLEDSVWKVLTVFNSTVGGKLNCKIFLNYWYGSCMLCLFHVTSVFVWSHWCLFHVTVFCFKSLVLFCITGMFALAPSCWCSFTVDACRGHCPSRGALGGDCSGEGNLRRAVPTAGLGPGWFCHWEWDPWDHGQEWSAHHCVGSHMVRVPFETCGVCLSAV